MEQTFLMVKPDGVIRGLIGEIIGRFEKKGLKLSAAKLVQLTKEQAKTHYAEHKDKPFFADLTHFITSGPVFAMVFTGDQAVLIARALIGNTDPLQALPGSIRSDYALHKERNIIHGSDSVESAQREIANIFQKEELLDYQNPNDTWL